MFLRYNYAALLWAFFILALCAIPGNRLPHLAFLDWLRPDKIAHLFLFGVLAYLFIKGFRKQTTFAVLNQYPKMYAILISIIYGIVIELLQEYVFYGRSGEMNDAMADAVGALIGLWVYKVSVKYKVTGNEY